MDDLVDRLRRAKNMTLRVGALWRMADEAADRIEALESRIAKANALAELLKEARVDLAGYVAADWPEDLRAKYPTYESKHRRDMALCWQIDAALAAHQATKEGEA